MHGYQLMQEMAARTDGAWRPSPGASIPRLALLEDEGYVTVTREGGRKLAALTDEGRSHAFLPTLTFLGHWNEISLGASSGSNHVQAMPDTASLLSNSPQDSDEDEHAQHCHTSLGSCTDSQCRPA